MWYYQRMGFKELLNQNSGKSAGCKVRFILNQLSEVDRLDAEDAIEPGSGYSGATLAKALNDASGVSISASAVNNHRKGACPCPSQTL